MSNPAQHLGLLLIDFQDPFLNLIPDRDRLLKRTSFAVEAASLLGCSLAITEQLPAKLGNTTATLKQILPENTPVFDKNTFSAMEADGLGRWIESIPLLQELKYLLSPQEPQDHSPQTLCIPL